MSRALPLWVLGFLGGALVGFVYGQAVRSRASEAVSTEVKGGVVTVSLDTVKLLRGGLGL